MKKAPLLATLALAAACDDGEQIKAFLTRPDVQDVIATVKDRCADLGKYGQLLGDRTTDDSFIANLNDTSCQCDMRDYGRRCEFNHSDDEGRSEGLLLMDHVDNGERVSVRQIQDRSPTLSISVNPYNYRGCDMRAFTDSSHPEDFSFNSERPDVIRACIDFRNKVKETITAIINMVQRR